MGDGGLTGNGTESMGWLCVGGMRETKVTQLGSEATFQKVSSPGRRLGNRKKKKLEIQTHGATDTGQQLSIVA